MVSQGVDLFIKPLRLVHTRLSATPHWQLPQVVPYLAGILATCGPVFSQIDDSGSRDGSDTPMLAYRIKTRLSNLLQDKTPQARWAAVVLAKAIVEAGGVETLRGSDAWVRSMIGILGKADPVSTKKLCLATLTRCFLLTQGHQSLARELTTPVLPAFLTACLKILDGTRSSNQSLVLTTLQSLNEILPRHPASFRPFQVQIRSCILPMLASTPSSLQDMNSYQDEQPSLTVTNAIADSARRTLVLLCVCAPKKTEADEWAKKLRLLCETIHVTADRLFRALVEDRRLAGYQQSPQAGGETVRGPENDPMELRKWIGIQGGIERLEGLLRTLHAFVATPTEYAVAIPIGVIVDIFNRLMSVHPRMSGAQINAEIGRDEREGLMQGLPHVHAAAINLISSLIQRLERSAASFHHEILESCFWVLDLEHSNVELRIAVYRAVHLLVRLFGLSLSESLRSSLSDCLNVCCEDILPLASKTQHRQPNMSQNKKSSTNGMHHSSADAYQKPIVKRWRTEQPPTRVIILAAELISAALTYLPEKFITAAVRARIDRTALLTKDRDVMLACILYPPTVGPQNQSSNSLIPFLARVFPDSCEGEALMRPRIPVIQSKQVALHVTDGSEVDSEDEEPMYDHIYSGSGVSNIEMLERRSTVEDSTQADRELQKSTPATLSNDLISLSYTQTDAAEVSMVEVPETQPIPVTTSNKRMRDDVVEDQLAVPWSNAKSQESDQPPVTDPEAKRPRLVATSPELSELANLSRSARMEEKKGLPTEARQPINTSNPRTMANAPSDSEDSTIPEIDTSLSTDEDEDDNELGEAET